MYPLRWSNAAALSRRVLLAAALLGLGIVPPRALGASANEVATHAYLQAVHTAAQEVTANVSASIQAMNSRIGQIDSECPGALAHVPVPATGVSGFAPGDARRRGESNLQSKQRGELLQEVAVAVLAAWNQPDRQVQSAFAASVESLHWGNPTIAHAVQLEVERIHRELATPEYNVCADIRAWIASDYKLLSPATKALVASEESPERTGANHLNSLFVRYESAHDRYELKVVAKLIHHLQGATSLLDRGVETLQLQLEALPPPPTEAKRPKVHVRMRNVVIGHGRTLAGTRYKLLVALPRGRADQRARGCVSIAVATGSHISSFDPCFPKLNLARASMGCEGGLITIDAQTPPSVRTVELRLSDGKHVTSRIARLAARLGGPAGLYYQVVRGPSPIPVTLVERDAQGRTVRVVRLQRVAGCMRHPRRTLPGGVRTIVSESVPQGPTFAIVGERYRLYGQVHLELAVNIDGEHGGLSGPSNESRSATTFGGKSGRIGESRGPSRPSRRTPFQADFTQGCIQHPYTIVYGLLSAPQDTVFARAAGKLYPLRTVPIPSILHSKDVLAYAVLLVPATELVTRDKTGKTVSSEPLGFLATNAFEECEGETEATESS